MYTACKRLRKRLHTFFLRLTQSVPLDIVLFNNLSESLRNLQITIIYCLVTQIDGEIFGIIKQELLYVR